MHKNRVKPVAPEDLTERQRKMVKPFMWRDGNYPNVFGTLAHHMDLADAWAPFGMYTMQTSQVDPLQREVVVMATAIEIGSDYEWHHHKRIALGLGLTEAQSDAIEAGKPTGDGLFDLLVKCAVELRKDAKLSDETWEKMTARFGLQYTLDVIMTAGAYTAFGMVLNSCGVQIERAK